MRKTPSPDALQLFPLCCLPNPSPGLLGVEQIPQLERALGVWRERCQHTRLQDPLQPRCLLLHIPAQLPAKSAAGGNFVCQAVLPLSLLACRQQEFVWSQAKPRERVPIPSPQLPAKAGEGRLCWTRVQTTRIVIIAVQGWKNKHFYYGLELKLQDGC